MVANPGVVGTGVIREYSERLADLAEDGALDTPVPTCGDWTLADLVWHLGEVQDFWGFVIDERPRSPDLYVQPNRPDSPWLSRFLRDATDGLVGSLDPTAWSESAWSWSDDHSVGFTVRRQSHEALMHYVDGALALGFGLRPVDPALAADGIDEMVTVMLEPVADGVTFEPSIALEIRSTDTGDSWRIILGSAVLVSGERTDHVIPSAGVGDQPGDWAASGVAIAGHSVDLDLWLWGRGDASALTVTGSDVPGDLLDRLRSALSAATQ